LKLNPLSDLPLETQRVLNGSWQPFSQEQAAGESNSEPRIRIDDIPSIFTLNSQGIQWVVEGIMAEGSVTSFCGEAGGGKSTFTTPLSGHVAVGADFLGRRCRQRPVLICDRENPLPVVVERFTRLGIQDGGGLKIWGAWLPYPVPQPAAGSILGWVEQTNPKPLIIIDSLIAFLEGDENDAAVMRAFMQQLRRLADLGAAVIVLHHSGKAETTRNFRGSSDFKASIDVGYTLTNLGEGRLERLRLRAFKTRFMVESDLIIHYRDGQFISDERSAAVEITVTEQLRALLRRNPDIKGVKFQSEAASLGLGAYRARTFLEEGVKLGVIVRTRGKNNSAHYRLAGDSEASSELF
jgi:predicted ATP-dependent serine protease